MLMRSISPYVNKLLSKTQESVQASGFSPSMRRIDTISTESKGGGGQRETENYGKEKPRGDRTAARETVKYKVRE